MKGRGYGNLVTCILEPDREGWMVMDWISDGRVPNTFEDESLTAVTDRAAVEIATLYAGQPEAAEAELQFAIYPWNSGGGTIVDLTTDADGFVGHILETGREYCGATLEALVAELQRSHSEHDQLMLRWVRKVSTL